jgi:DNA repair exonuclease SbcCD ATPase subunit
MADDLKALLNRIESQNKQLESLINENKRLLESPFELTSLERLKVLTEETKSEFKELKETLKDANDELVKIDSTKYDKFFKSTKNILSDVKKLKKEIKDLRAAGDVDKAKELEKILADVTNKASSYYRMANREQEALNKRIVEGTHALDDFAEAAEQRTRAFRKGINEIASGSKEIYSGAKKIIEPWGKANHEAMNYARSMSMSAKTANAFLSKTVSWAAKNNIGVLFNKTNEELIKMQGKYSEVLGRNVQLTGEQKKNMLAIETFLGEDGMIDIANNLENFGLGMSDSAEFIHKQMSEAAKSGIAAS